ncbi:MAG: GNAT family N-acetyltransferase [Alphaproteobacteria bacterium]
MAIIRDALAADCAAIQQIYAHNVLTGTATFETTPPDQAEMTRRLAKIQDAGLPFLAAERAGDLVGFAYASPYNERYAYRFTLGNSVYVGQNAQGQGIGRALMGRLIGRCTALHYRQMIAVIGDGNAASMKLHEAVGFRQVGTLRGAGFKFGRWVDVALLQCALGPGDGADPMA